LTAIDITDERKDSQAQGGRNKADYIQKKLENELFLLITDIFFESHFFQISHEGSGAREREDFSPL